MARPTFSWAVYTLFRLVGVVFIAWALVAQCIILAEYVASLFHGEKLMRRDMKAYNLSRERMRLTADIGDQLSRIGAHGATSGSTSSASESLAMAAEKWREAMGNIASSISSFARSPTTTSSLSTSSAAGGKVGGERVVTALDAAVTAGITTGEGVLRRGRKRQSPANGSVEDDGQNALEEGYYDGSGVPLHPGGAVLLFASILGVLLFAQAGVPERILHDHFAWIGASSTPAFLGFGQVLMASCALSAYASNINLVPAWGLLRVGIINLLLGAFLKYAFRRLPKSPPPAFYFNYAHRLFYSSPPPEFHKVLFQKPLDRSLHQAADPEAADLSYLKELDTQEEGRRGPPSAAAQPFRVHKARRGERNATIPREGGAAARSARGNDSLQQLSSTSHLYGEAGLEPHQDVLRGGYPTFTGHGLTDARRQVPTGVVEHGSRGEAIRFLREDGEGAGRTGPQDSGYSRGAIGGDGERKLRKKKKEKRDKTESGYDREKDNKEEKRGWTHSAPSLSHYSFEEDRQGTREASNRGTFGQHPLPRITQAPLPVPPIATNHTSRPMSTISARSVVYATRDLGGRFPAPPPRSQTLPSAPSTNGGKSDRLTTRPKRSYTHPTPLKSPTLAVADPSGGMEEAYDGVEDLRTSPHSLVNTKNVSEQEVDTPHTAKSSARSPLTPHLTAMTSKAKVVKLGMAQGRTVSPEPPLPHLPSPSASKDEPQLDVEVEDAPSAPPSIACSISLSSTTPKSARRASFSSIPAAPPSRETRAVQRSSSLRHSGESPPRPKASQGVRFNLSSVEETTEPSSTEPTPLSSAFGSLTSPLRSASLRIPGTKYTLSLPSMLSPSAGHGKRMSTGSISSELASVTEDNADGREKKDKRDTMIIAWPGVSPIEHLSIGHHEAEEEDEGRPELRARKSSDLLDPTQKVRPRSLMIPSRSTPPSEVVERERRRSSVNL